MHEAIAEIEKLRADSEFVKRQESWKSNPSFREIKDDIPKWSA